MKNILMLAFGVYLIGLLVGCNTAEKRASELYDKGAYLDAVEAYDKIVKDEPNNAGAKAGLLNARTKLISTRLIEIRKARLSSQRTGDLLLSVLELEQKWNIQPPGPAAFTQKEETDFATAAILADLSAAALAPFPLRKEFELKHFEKLFRVSHSSQFARVENQINLDGLAACTKLSKVVKHTHIYIANFAKQFCNFWTADDNIKIDYAVANNSLFSELASEISLQGFSKGAEDDVKLILSERLRGSPWFAKTSRQKLKSQVKGNWHQDLQRNTTQLLHQYSVEEAYVESVSVRKTRQIPVYTSESVYNSSGVVVSSQPKTTMKEEVYWENEPQTRYHSVQKTFPFGGWQLNQKLEVEIELSSAPLNHAINLRLKDVSNTQDTESDVNYPSIGLLPKQALKIPNPKIWLSEHEVKLGDDFTARLDELWKELYCRETSIENFSDTGDKVFQCISLRSMNESPPRFVEDWHTRFIGLNSRDTQLILKSRAD